MIIRSPRRNRFTVVPNAVLDDSCLSWKALGLLVFVLSKPDSWQTRLQHLTTLRREGRDAVASGLEELHAAGYLHYVRVRDQDGHLAGRASLIFDSPPDKTDVPTELRITRNSVTALQVSPNSGLSDGRKTRNSASSLIEVKTEEAVKTEGDQSPQNLGVQDARVVKPSSNGSGEDARSLVAYYVDTCKELNREPLISKKGMVAKRISGLLHDGAATAEEIRRGLRRAVQKSNPGILENLIAEARPLPSGTEDDGEEKDPWEEWDRNRRIGMEAGAGRRATQEDRDYFRALAEKNAGPRR